ncbi:MAG: hypothetical protein JRM82_04585 [Nitrososphaerota archaeon]|nr:hypothetical protein [Nitrososphaerota archaeon]
MNKRTRGHRDIIDDLAAQGKHLEAFLLAWSIVEFFASDTLYRVFLNISGRKPNWEWVLDMQVSTKLRTLKQLGALTDEEYSAIWVFKKKRDELDHTHGLYYQNYPIEVKEALVKKGGAAVDATYDAFDRATEATTKGGTAN